MAVPTPQEKARAELLLKREQRTYQWTTASGKAQHFVGSIFGWSFPELTAGEAFFGLSWFAAYDGIVRPIITIGKVPTSPIWGLYAGPKYLSEKAEKAAQKAAAFESYVNSGTQTEAADAAYAKATGHGLKPHQVAHVAKGAAFMRSRAEDLFNTSQRFEPAKRQAMLDAARLKFGGDLLAVFGGLDPDLTLSTNHLPSVDDWVKILAFDEMTRYLEVGTDDAGRRVMGGVGVAGAQARGFWLHGTPGLNGKLIGYRDELKFLRDNEKVAEQQDYGMTFDADLVESARQARERLAESFANDPKYVHVQAAMRVDFEMTL